MIKNDEVVENEDKFDVMKAKLATTRAVEEARASLVDDNAGMFMDADSQETDVADWGSDEILRRKAESEWDTNEKHRREREDAMEVERLAALRLEEDAYQRDKKKGPNPLMQYASDAAEKREREQAEIKERMVRREKIEAQRLKDLRSGAEQKDAKYQLIYNNAGRSEALRLLLLYTNESFEEKYIQGKHYKESVINGALTLDRSHFLSRSNWAMLRYLGVVHNLYPTVSRAQTEVDELIGELRDFATEYFNLRNQTDCDRALAERLMIYEHQIVDTNRPWLFERLTIADFELVALTKSLHADKFVDTHMFAEAFPKITTLVKKISNNDEIFKYDRTRRRIA